MNELPTAFSLAHAHRLRQHVLHGYDHEGMTLTAPTRADSAERCDIVSSRGSHLDNDIQTMNLVGVHVLDNRSRVEWEHVSREYGHLGGLVSINRHEVGRVAAKSRLGHVIREIDVDRVLLDCGPDAREVSRADRVLLSHSNCTVFHV